MEKKKDGLGERVREIIVEQLGVEPEKVVPDADFVEDLGADIPDLIELSRALGKEFSIEISLEEIPDEGQTGIETVGEVIEYIEQRVDE